MVDTTSPTLAEVTVVSTPTNDTTPSYVFSSNETGSIAYGGSCASSTTSVSSTGNQTITFNTLSAGTYNDCTITVTDSAGNVSNTLSISSFVIDTTAPSLAEVTAVTNPTNDTTPSYVFSSDETGTIAYGGSCSSATTSVSSTGNQTISFSTLSAGNYNDCTITVTDSAGNASSALSVSSFTIDTTAPTVAEVTVVSTPTNDTTPNYVFSSDETGTIAYGGSCSSSTTSVSSTGNQTITFNTLSAGTYSDCTITVTDSAGNASNVLTATSFTIDTTAPTLAEVTAVSTPTSDNTPSYVFSADETGSIAYGGSCSSATTTVSSTGNQTITFNALSDGTYSDCTITVTDSAGNASSALTATSFIVDTTAPTLSLSDAIHTPAPDSTPTFSFSSNEAGTIAYSGSCSSSTTAASSGSNSITLNSLSSAQYSDCSLTVTDSAGNASSSLSLGTFMIMDATNLMAFYPFTGNANDESGNGLNGTATNGASLTTDRNSNSNEAYNFDGTDDYIDLPDGFADFTGGLTFAVWANVNETSGRNFQRFINLSTGSNVDLIYFGQYGTTNQLAMESYNSGTATSAGDPARTSSSAISTGTWQHFVVTQTGTTFNFYVNGSLVSSTGATFANRNVTRTFNTLGLSEFSGDAKYKGSLDEIFIYGRVLSDAEISLLAGNADNTAPTLAEVTAVSTPTNDTTPDYVFSSTETGSLSYGGSCSSSTTSVSSTGNQTVTINTLSAGTYSDCTITLTDAAGNASNVLAVTSFTIDTTAPTLAEVTAVSTPTIDTTPNYVFFSRRNRFHFLWRFLRFRHDNSEFDRKSNDYFKLFK